MLTIEIQDTAVKAWLTAMPVKVHGKLLNAVDKLTVLLQRKTVMEKLSGQVLNFHTHKLQKSIQRNIKDSSTAVIGSVFSVKSVAPYAAIHEFGDVFERAVTMAWGRKVKDPKKFTFHYPERSFLRSSLREMEPRIVSDMKQAVIDGTK